jgi:hypothetical protein
MDLLNSIFSKLTIDDNHNVNINDNDIDEITNTISKININDFETPIKNILIDIYKILVTKQSCTNHIHMNIYESPNCF